MTIVSRYVSFDLTTIDDTITQDYVILKVVWVDSKGATVTKFWYLDARK